MPLTPKQRRFIDEYLVDVNATQAAVRAGYPRKSARQTGAENLSKPVIRAEIARRMAERSAKLAVTADSVLARLNREADDRLDGSPASRVRALELLGRHLGMFREKTNVEVSAGGGNPVQIVAYMPPIDPDPDDDPHAG